MGCSVPMPAGPGAERAGPGAECDKDAITAWQEAT